MILLFTLVLGFSYSQSSVKISNGNKLHYEIIINKVKHNCIVDISDMKTNFVAKVTLSNSEKTETIDYKIENYANSTSTLYYFPSFEYMWTSGHAFFMSVKFYSQHHWKSGEMFDLKINNKIHHFVMGIDEKLNIIDKGSEVEVDTHHHEIREEGKEDAIGYMTIVKDKKFPLILAMKIKNYEMNLMKIE